METSTILAELIAFWAEADPIDGYVAGLKSARGKIFVPNNERINWLNEQLSTLRCKLPEIDERELRLTVAKLLDLIKTGVAFPLPPQAIADCAEGVFFILLNGGEQADYTAVYLENAEKLVAFEAKRWVGHQASIE